MLLETRNPIMPATERSGRIRYDSQPSPRLLITVQNIAAGTKRKGGDTKKPSVQKGVTDCLKPPFKKKRSRNIL